MSPAGRPEIGHPINIRLEDELLAAVDELAEALGQSRAATIRALIRDSLTRWWPEVQDESNGEMLGSAITATTPPIARGGHDGLPTPRLHM